MKKTARGQAGFTLLEILAVLVLLAFIMAMVTPEITKRFQEGQIRATRAQIEATVSALQSYQMSTGMYPTTEQGLRALFEKPTIPPIPERWNGPYTNKKSVPKDAWGNELHYVCPGVHNPDSFDLFSLGRDNTEGGTGINEDIGNW